MDTPTLIARLTPPGAGAIATLAVRGPQAWPIARSLFHGRLPEHRVPGQFYLGRFGETANTCDEVVLAATSDGLELHCHGGVAVVSFLQELFVTRGVLACSWQDFATDGGITRLRRLAREQLIQAPTVKTAALLLDQVHGAFENTLTEILGALHHKNRRAVTGLLSRLRGTQHLGRHLVHPFRVVVAGPPNVGKSSLVNALAGFTRSVVSPVPGTTRDVVTTGIALDGWPVELIDTAGLHASADPLEKEGMARAREVIKHADVRLWVCDASLPAMMRPAEIACDGTIINKIDLVATQAANDAVGEIPSYEVRVSAATGQGIAELCDWIGDLLCLDQKLVAGEGLAFTPDLGDQVLAAYEALAAGDWTRVEECVRAMRD